MEATAPNKSPSTFILSFVLVIFIMADHSHGHKSKRRKKNPKFGLFEIDIEHCEGLEIYTSNGESIEVRNLKPCFHEKAAETQENVSQNSTTSHPNLTEATNIIEYPDAIHDFTSNLPVGNEPPASNTGKKMQYYHICKIVFLREQGTSDIHHETLSVAI